MTPDAIGEDAAHNLAKAREILRDYDAGQALDVIGDGWLVRFAAHIAGPLCAMCRGKGYLPGDPEANPIEDCPKCKGTGHSAQPTILQGEGLEVARDYAPHLDEPVKSGSATRDARQRSVAEWCVASFGVGPASSIQQRGVRLLEEAIELYQAAGCNARMAHKLIDFIFSRPAGRLSKEIGQVGLVLLSMAEAAAVSADAEEAKEVARVREKPPSHYAERNKAKNAAGFDTTVAAVATEEQGSASAPRNAPPSPLLRNEVVDTVAYIREMSGKAPCLNLSMVRLVNLVDALEAALSSPLLSGEGNSNADYSVDRGCSDRKEG